LLISDWKNGVINQLVGGKSRLFKAGYKAAADIALMNDGETLMVPDMKAGELDFIETK
jgi:gluconolactonase